MYWRKNQLQRRDPEHTNLGMTTDAPSGMPFTLLVTFSPNLVETGPRLFSLN